MIRALLVFLVGIAAGKKVVVGSGSVIEIRTGIELRTIRRTTSTRHPLRPLRVMTDEALRDMQPRFNKLYAKTGRPSIAPEKLLRALLLQALYSVRSERMLMEQLDYNLLFRWFVGLNPDPGSVGITNPHYSRI
jgi:Transposase domain (DUF772)